MAQRTGCRYNSAMFRTGLHRRLIALVAAYGLALQALLAAAVALSPGAAAAAVICAGERSGGASQSVPPATPHHGIGCALCTLACAGGAALPTNAPSVARMADPGTVMRQPYLAEPVPRGVARAGLARGPPA
ncbi:MAG TPA: hypothetical protein VGG01_17615 [Xanthobacteraceae bacterium]